MLKGINKQIIEIKCTKSEYFDKILLFVNSEKSAVPQEILRKNAMIFAQELTNNYGIQRKNKSGRYAILILSICVAVFLLMLVVLCM